MFLSYNEVVVFNCYSKKRGWISQTQQTNTNLIHLAMSFKGQGKMGVLVGTELPEEARQGAERPPWWGGENKESNSTLYC